MSTDGPSKPRRGASDTVAVELSAAGFDDLHEIGRGGFGIVYRCIQPALDRMVAVKILTATVVDDENQARFFREQRAMGRLTGHPHIVGALQVGILAGGRPYIVMQCHPKGSLDRLIRRAGPLGLEGALRVGVRIAGALETAHRLGIIHRDVKPSNILLTEYGEPALTDFGIAHMSGGFQTATGTVTGSPAFTAPEVLGGEPATAVSDIYSLGATLFCAITGHSAFERHSGEQVVAQFLRITTQPVPDLRKKGVPENVSAVIECAMSADPRNRPNTAAEFGDKLRAIQLQAGYPVDEMALLVNRGDPREDVEMFAAPSHTARTSVSSPSTGSDFRRSGGNLPLELTSFVGRRRELTLVKEKLTESRLVTLTGSGGVGKTRLALRAAANLQRAFSDGVCLVELSELHDETLLVEVVAANLGVWDRSIMPLEEVVVDFLTPRHILLVLDNCEHLVDAVASLAETLLRSCLNLRILTTSRESLGVGGESILRVPSLTVPVPDGDAPLQGLPQYDAVTLFAQRAAAALPGFSITEQNRITVVRICHRLDGLPLSIELAAARLRAMSVEQILERLTDKYAFLTLGNRNAPARQQTIRLCIDWSHDLCTPKEQQMWARLSVFAGSFELNAAEVICDSELLPEDLLDLVTALVDKSILIREDYLAVVRFRMLETLRDYGSEKLDEAGSQLRFRRRHRDWYHRLVSKAEADWISPRQLEWIARLEREQSNLREAMQFCLTQVGDGEAKAVLRIATALLHFWNARGLLTEGRRWLDRALAHPLSEPSIEQVKAIYADSLLAERQGDLSAGVDLIEKGRALTARMVDPVAHALLAQAEGLLALYSGNIPRACSRLEASRAVFGVSDDLCLQITALGALGWAYELRGDVPLSITCYEEMLAITEDHGELMYRSYSLWAMGVTRWRQGDRHQAAQLMEDGLRLTRKIDDRLMSAMCLESLAWASGDQNQQRAAVLMGAAEALREKIGSPTVLLPNLLVYHELCDHQARNGLGEKAFEKAYSIGYSLGFQGATEYALREEPGVTGNAVKAMPVLTKRERQVAALVAQGLTNKEIAAKLVISPRTAQGHVEHILTKLGFTSRAQIAAWVVGHQE
ncbi:protein kinase [Rhodococcus sp. ACPA4]|uniref:protein kinase domain-containing protein n=1 Tax=Rhodococcus sp. ACPA4 TaxID=2028571 RepID=UPI000BB0E882|nr:protein kinase [Rhodococcus sp. ACPA4]PBC35955.1 protein kinase [Rhodococcus sp. ACPA4]